MSGMPESGTLMSGLETMEIQEQLTMDDTVGGSAGIDCGTYPDDPVVGSADPGCGSDLPQSAARQSGIGEQVGSMDEGDNIDDEDLWEDVEEDDEESGAAEEITENARGSRPSEDDIGNNFVRIVHLNGVHYLPLLHCLCGGEERLHVDLTLGAKDNIQIKDILIKLISVSQARLIPTSFTRIKTLFTCAVLDDYRLSNLEMKASAYQYWQKIVRITSPDGVTQVPDLYRELRRLSREWRWLKKIKWAGFGHENRDPMNPAPGELSIFCPTCPQPGVNLPPDWKADQQRNPEPYTRDMTIDGNFTADHVQSKNPGPDLWLSEGGGMMASRVRIEDFMKTAVTRLTKEPCENTFRAIEQAMLSSKACDINGIIAVACARHGCFAPNSLTDLPFGEQQKCADHAVLRAIETTNMEQIQKLLLLYDIMCQYIVHMKERIGHHLPKELVIDRGIGAMHVHGHQRKCFPRFAPAFIPGAGIVSGEILESLWSTLNAASPMARTATLAHRAEILDDHMSDSNWKKLLGMTAALCKRYRKAKSMSASAQEYYLALKDGSPADMVATWDREIEDAESRRLDDPSGQSMDILLARSASSTSRGSDDRRQPPQTVDEEWIQLGLDIEASQLSLLAKVRKLGHHPREDDRKTVEAAREQLRAQIAVFLTARESYQITSGMVIAADNNGYVAQFEEIPEPHEASPQTSSDAGPPEKYTLPPEAITLPLPSALLDTTSPLRDVELSLRELQADKLLQDLREAIAEKSFVFSHIMRVAPRKAVRTRSRGKLLKIEQNIASLSAAYSKCRDAFDRLGAPPSISQRYKVLRKQDTQSSTAILDPNTVGASTLRLSWIWQMGDIDSAADPASVTREFERVHYLRGRAQKNRWSEEFMRVGYEMQWTTRFFLYQADLWRTRGAGAAKEGGLGPGPLAYAQRKTAMWKEMAVLADQGFWEVNPSYTKLCT
ncbi:hypothetical protein LshimejAT787_0402530 [Lyophyllum shimeji]|uniref:CxC2-like cysteine cluster KDZ transposase-associated domain-containing protein n=2 Tax=Lyophyllum shimeji TaxID=47721 RepID=A0A9P3PKX4_LYOSH|nr:hypothetical protein LshimejAT787_0402530 [Lyophyllum shimeji]